MKKKYSSISIILSFYVLLQLTAYIFSVFIGVSGKNYLIDYTSIVINLLVGLLLFLFFQKKDTLIVLIALAFTLVADTGLILLDNIREISVGAFVIVQILYAIRVRQLVLKLPLWFDIGLRSGLVVIGEMFAFLMLRENYDCLITITVVYFVNLIINLTFSLINFKQNIIFAWGLILFALCDISLGLSNLSDFININNSILINGVINFPIDLVWMFYFPSQVLIVLSMKYNRIVKDEQ